MDWPRLKVSYTNSGWDETFRPLNTKLRTELTWWIEHLKFCNGRTFSRLNPQIIIQTDVYLILWGAVCNGDQMSGQWSEKERTIHMNILELSAINWFFFLRQREESESHTLSGRQQGSLSYLLKMGGTRKGHMIKLSKGIWHYFLNHNISITVEYLPSILNVVADRESRKKPDSSEGVLHPKVFQAVSRLLGSPTIDLFSSPLCHQLSQYIAWHPDPFNQGKDVMTESRSYIYISPF